MRRRGYVMPQLIDALAEGKPEVIAAAVDAVWEQMRGREGPANS